MEKRFKTGSIYFFEGMEGFHPHDTDTLVITDRLERGKSHEEIHLWNPPMCLFYYKDRSREEWMELFGQSQPIQLIKLLCKEFTDYIGFTIDDLRLYKDKFARMDEKHKYCSYIYDCYLKNGKFELTQEQREQAYKLYKAERQENKNVKQDKQTRQ